MKKSISVGKAPHIEIGEIAGNLRVTGWENNEIHAKTNGESLQLVETDEKVTISCDDDLTLSLPQAAQIKIAAIAGDATLRTLRNYLVLAEVGGDLTLRNIGDAKISKIGGDFMARQTRSLNITAVGGDASIRSADGNVNIANIGNDLHLRDLQGDLNANVGDDALIYISPQEGADYQLSAGDDILLRLPLHVDAELNLSAGSDLIVNIPDLEKSDENPCALKLGLGTAKITLSAGDDLRVTTESDHWADAASFGIPDFPDDFADRITSKVEEKLKLAEEKIFQAEKSIKGFNFSPENWGKKSKGSSSKKVSTDERLLILKMLEEKKISAADAEKLLAALEA
ncbi:MAG: hypothetical protein HN390_13635 [Anaerolineae bacterium]|jgi:hypothetical protein|nr:hypothetical protein [Anaerolineae bacterium]